MIILGLHFGHDAAVCVLREGKVASYVIRERVSRIKHAATLDRRCIELALSEAEVSSKQIDFCAIASTQFTEPVIDDPSFFQIKDEPFPGKEMDSKYLEILRKSGIGKRQDTGQLKKILYEDSGSDDYQKAIWSLLFPEYLNQGKDSVNSFFWFDEYIGSARWKEGVTLDEIGTLKNKSSLDQSGLDKMFHYPVSVWLDQTKIPAAYIHHHMAHASASFFNSPFESAFILSHDGFANGDFGSGYQSGMFYVGLKNKIYPVNPHHLHIGGFYDRVGTHLGLGNIGAAGKLMGLASYGKPLFYDSDFVGNHKDFKLRGIEMFSSWISHCEDRAKFLEYDFKNYRDPRFATDPINADIAASSQKVFEEIRLKTVQKVFEYSLFNKLPLKNLCLTGGTALNCPSNSQIFNEGPFDKIFVEPNCDDSGIALGAALNLYHNILGEKRKKNSEPKFPYLGPRHSDIHIRESLERCSAEIEFKKLTDPGKMAAADLVKDRVVGWFQGKSEVGPRALGARSILADPRNPGNWKRVNDIKRREYWRPFAPAVLESEFSRWFAGCPEISPYMLFNAEVLSDKIPAVTHVDNTARVQTVNKTNGNFFKLILEFRQLTGVPVVLNTSFNGPAEPIVESPDQALRFFIESDLDVLYLACYRVKKLQAG